MNYMQNISLFLMIVIVIVFLGMLCCDLWANMVDGCVLL